MNEKETQADKLFIKSLEDREDIEVHTDGIKKVYIRDSGDPTKGMPPTSERVEISWANRSIKYVDDSGKHGFEMPFSLFEWVSRHYEEGPGERKVKEGDLVQKIDQKV